MKNIPLGAWIFGAVVVIAVVFYQAFVRIPEARIEIASDANLTCEQRAQQCYDDADEDVEYAIDSYCLENRFNSQSDIEAAVKVESECMNSDAFIAAARLEACRDLYRHRLRLNCTFLNVASVDLKREKQERIDICLSKLYECK